MKNLILTTVAVIFALTTQAQEVFVKKISDEMDDKAYYLLNKDLVLANEERTKGIRLDVFIDEKKDDIYVSGIAITMINIGNCCEKNELTILFEDGTKLNMKSWNKFNCKGDAWFKPSANDIEMLSTKKMKKVRITNGSTYDSFTAETTGQDADFYINAFKAVTDKVIKEVKK